MKDLNKLLLLSCSLSLLLPLPVKADNNFTFGGYFRSGIGFADTGGDQQCYALRSPYNFRLGNECQTFGELAFSKKVAKGDDGEVFSVHFRNAFSVDGHEDFETPSDQAPLREAFGVFEMGDGMKWWAGKRFYRRHDLHIFDYFYWDTSGPGFGVEDIKLGESSMKMAVAMFNEVVSNSASRRFIDLRVYGINTNPNGSLTVGLGHLSASNPDRLTNASDFSGLGINIQHQQNSVMGGFNKFILQYGMDAMADDPGRRGQGYIADGILQNGVATLRVVEQLVVRPAGTPYSGMFGLVWEQFDYGDSDKGEWLMLGVRPQYHLNENYGIALELGHEEWKANDNSDKQALNKLTLAYIITPSSNFFARPQMRLFASYFTGNAATVNASTFGTDKDNEKLDSAMTYGAQVEAWF